ncbi:MAG TPA: DUF6298 domain-containing protein [Opitutaceae bacterium]|nr:DUF6298 domain-containing protein [Opitutaceae bacterium]
MKSLFLAAALMTSLAYAASDPVPVRSASPNTAHPEATSNPSSPAAYLDFSSAGYGGGGVPLPFVPAKYAVSPSASDDTAAIQAAIDAVAALPLDTRGFRGAVLLRPGTYHVAGQLRVDASGVVLRGQRATLVATGQSRRTLIQVGGRFDRTSSPGVPITSETVVAGSTQFEVSNVDGFSCGERVLIDRPSTGAWMAALGMTNFPGPGQYKDARVDWVPGSRDLEWERTVVAIDTVRRTLTIDAPITTAIEAKFGGGTVRAFRWRGRVNNVGVEDLTCVGETNPANPKDEEHAWICVAVDSAENAWVRHVVARKFVCSAVWVATHARAVTVEDCAYVEPVAESAGWRRVSFYVDGQQVLVNRCASEDGRHDFAAGHCAAGPNAFLDCRAVDAQVDAGPFESWASGVLYDGVSVSGAGLSLANIGIRTQGAGWTAANSVLWNCSAASKMGVDDPPGAPNHVVVTPAPLSLYRAQLQARCGASGLAAVGTGPAPVVVLSEGRVYSEPGGRDAANGALAAAAASMPADPRDDGDIPAAPPPKPVVPRPVHALSIVNGYFIVDGRALFGGSMNSALWKGQLIPGREAQMGTSPTRWAPGRIGPHLTEDLDRLTDEMRAQQTAFYWAFPGLWYDRRRDEHSVTIREDPEVWAPFFEPPWALSGQGRNSMGLSKYDLTKFNPWFFSRLRELADDCTSKGLVLACQVYDNHNVEEAAAHWADFAWRPLNALQDTGFPEPPHYENAGQNRHHIADQFYDPTNPVRRHLHELCIRHTLDVLGDSPNVIFTLGYQFAGPLRFQEFFLDTVAAWEKEHGRRVHVALQTSKAVTDAILADPKRAPLVDVVDLRYWQYLPDGKLFAPDGKGKNAFRELRTAAFGRDPVMRSTPELVYRQVREYRDRYPDKAIICGHAGFGPLPVLMAGGAEAVVAESTPPRDGPPHDDAAALRFISTRVAGLLPALKPIDGFATDAWCLGAEGRGMLIYSLRGASIELTRDLGKEAANATWFNPRNGEATPARLEAGSRTIAKPSPDAWLLWIKG